MEAGREGLAERHVACQGIGPTSSIVYISSTEVQRSLRFGRRVVWWFIANLTMFLQTKPSYGPGDFESIGELARAAPTQKNEDPGLEDNGEKQNKCHQCDYAFAHMGSLRTHFKTHKLRNNKKSGVFQLLPL